MPCLEPIPEPGQIPDVEHAVPCGAEPRATGTESSTAKVAQASQASRLGGGNHAEQGRKSGSCWKGSPTNSQPWGPTFEDRPKEGPPEVLENSFKGSPRLRSSPKIIDREASAQPTRKAGQPPGSQWLPSMIPGDILVKGEGLRPPHNRTE